MDIKTDHKTLITSLFPLEFLIVIIGFPLTKGAIQQALLMAVLLLSLIQLLMIGFAEFDRGCLIAGCLFLLWLLFAEIYFEGSFKRLFQAATAVMVLASSSLHKWTREELTVARNIYILYLISWIAIWITRPVFNGYTAFFGNSNALGVMALSAFVFLMLQPLENRIIDLSLLTGSLFMIVVSGSRAALLAWFAMVVSFFLQTRAAENGLSSKKIVALITIMVLFFAGVFSIIYPNLMGTSIGYKLNEISSAYTGKGIFTGRHYIWKAALDEIAKGPVIGRGTDYSWDMADSRSVHNLYLQTILQTGIIGVTLLLSFLLSVLRKIVDGNSRTCMLIASLVIAVLVHEIFEVSLTQNNWHYGMIYWFIFGIGISNSRELETVQY